MTFISKGAEPPLLEFFRATEGATWDGMHGDVKEQIRVGCLEEQNGFCAFCCSKLPAMGSLQRIAHVVPRAINPSRALDYSNMVTSCSSGREKAVEFNVKHEMTCDEAQGSVVLPISPLMHDCSTKFSYLQNGAIVPANDEPDSERTIEILNLDCFRLREARKEAISAALEMRNHLSAEQWNAVFLDPIPKYRPEFWPAIAGQSDENTSTDSGI
jgi:uncharacterized protein (TIGR02646 family)